ncbi:hypothetical protein AJ80_03064 [Polytolypa hystricis UAMH7299]|uniref:DUF1682 domain-containing protein n=1 Tax=Polytolypa hystricis (strain UAMH7299) TaxID=1447883 RepID=A0A2B7YKP2_POLH7|nr:hypothetical protein AJ80_03064 [Polytolypa hystricis UAMH7299]
MSAILQNILKGGAETPSPSSSGDADFADFPGAPEQPVAPVSGGVPVVNTPSQGATTAAGTAVPFTKWYRVWERTSPQDFIQEAFVLPFIILVLLSHFWGTRRNRRTARTWAKAHVPLLQSEFEVVGYNGIRKEIPTPPEADEIEIPEGIIKERSPQEFVLYATGRQNVAFVDVTIKLLKWYNPVYLFGDWMLSMVMDSWPAPTQKIDCFAYAFDGKEKDIVPVPAAEKETLERRSKANNSSYDGFVFAVVHKNKMRQLREDRYDVSLTFTKDNPKLPAWTTVMSESAEVTDMILTKDLISAIENAGDAFEYLVITDQPLEKPTTIDETTPRKRINLSLQVPSGSSVSVYDTTKTLFAQFLRLTDRLVSVAHFRAEVSRKIRNKRDEEIRRLKRADEEEKAEERKLAAEKIKKDEREKTLRNMSAEEQRKFLEKERDREAKRGAKKQSRRG